MKSLIIPNSSEIFSSAKSYIEKSFPVFLIHSVKPNGKCTCEKSECASIGKHPRTLHGLKDATRNTGIIQQELWKYPSSNLAIVTGSEAGIFVLDLDPRHGSEDTLWELQEKCGKLPHTVTVLTGGGGQHFYFKLPKNGRIPNRAGFLPGLDIRGEGGYVIAPPSVHVSGRRYAWDVSSHLEEMPVSDAPQWLLDLILARTNAPQRKPQDYWDNVIAAGLLEGRRNHTITSVAGHLLRRYVNPSLALELLLSWNASRGSPPLPEDEVIKIMESIAGRELKRRGKLQGEGTGGDYHV